MDKKFVSRAGEKLDFALSEFNLAVTGLICADFGCSTGGFTDCLLKRGAAKVYAVDTDYGELAWTLRNDPRVVVMEKTNAMHVILSETVDLVTVDVSWTKQEFVLPNALKQLKPDFFSPHGRENVTESDRSEGNLIQSVKDRHPSPLKGEGHKESVIISLIKPHYEADKRLLHKGKLTDEDAQRVTQETIAKIEQTLPLKSVSVIKSPILGRKGENSEYLVLWELHKVL